MCLRNCVWPVSTLRTSRNPFLDTLSNMSTGWSRRSQNRTTYDCILLIWTPSTQPANTCDKCRRHFLKSIVRCRLVYNTSTQSKQSAKTYNNICRKLLWHVCLPTTLQLSQSSPRGHTTTVEDMPLSGQQFHSFNAVRKDKGHSDRSENTCDQ